MKRISAVVASIVLSFSVAACSSGGSDTPQEPVTVTATPTPTETPSPTETVSPEISDAGFAALVRANTDAFDGATDEQIASAAKSVCDLWDSGATLRDVTRAVVKSGVDPHDGGFLAGAGTQAYCPEYASNFANSGV